MHIVRLFSSALHDLALTDQRWQRAAHGFVSRSRDILRSPKGNVGFNYLHDRGLTDSVIEQAVLGYNPTPHHEQRGSVQVWLPQGIVIPWMDHNDELHDRLWKVNIRRLDGGQPKYHMAKGSANGLYGISTLRLGDTVVMVEGEICALSLCQAVPQIVTPVATGSVTGSRLYRWIAKLALADRIILAFDTDGPGDKAAAWWQHIFPDAVRLRPGRHDINDMLMAGDDIVGWIESAL